MDQGIGLERLPRCLGGQFLGGQFAQLVIDQRQELASGVRVADQAGEVLRSVTFWHGVTGRDPHWLYFDSKLTSYAELSRLNQRAISFVTIRRRGAAITRRLDGLSKTDWHKAHLDIPKRLHKDIRYFEETVALGGYDGTLRQIAVTGL